MSHDGFSSSRFRRHSSKLHKDPPSFASRILRSSESNPSLKRHPSAPVYPRPPGGSRDHFRTRSNQYGSSSSSLDQSSAGPSPVLADSESSYLASSSNSANSRPPRPGHQSLNDHSSDEIVGGPFDSRGMLTALEENAGESDKPDKPDKRFYNQNRDVGSQPPSSPDFRRPQTLRQSASFSAFNHMDSNSNRSENERPSKRFSEDGRKTHGRSKKSSFSSFVNNIMGTPRGMKISAPENPVHVTHVGYDNQTGQFTGLPKEWQRLLQASGITKQEQEEHPQTMVDIMRFYEKNAQGDDQVWHKFDNAYPQRPTLPSPGATPGAVGSSSGSYFPPQKTSPPTSPRFPQNHEGSFENPRAPPPVPRGGPPTYQPGSPPPGGLIPNRAPPKPPTSAGMTPARPAPQAPPANFYAAAAQRPTQDLYGQGLRTPPIPETEVFPSEGQRSRSNSKTNEVQAPRVPAVVTSPTQYQQQQEHAMAAAQQAIASKQLDRSRSQRQQTQQPQPPRSELAQFPHPQQVAASHEQQAAPQGAQNAQSARAPPVARPRQRPRQSNAMDIRARLVSICNPGDPTEMFHNLNKIGQGASGGVFTGYETTHGCVAIKQMNLDLQPKKDLIINEILVMKDSKHKNVVNFLDSYLHGLDLWVIMEYMEGGSLTDVVTFNIMSEGQISAVCREVSLVDGCEMFANE